MGKLIKVTLLRSAIGRHRKQKETLRGLGLTRLHKTVYLPNTGTNRGMVYHVRHLVGLEMVSEAKQERDLEERTPRRTPSFRVLDEPVPSDRE